MNYQESDLYHSMSSEVSLMDGDVVGMASPDIAQLDTESSEEHLSEPLYYKFTSVLQKSSVLDTLLDKKKPLPVLKKPQPLKLYRCDQCDFTFNTKASVIQHKFYKHSTDPQPFKCELCDFKSVYRHNLKRHLSAVHDSKDPNREPTLKKPVSEVKKAKVTDHEPTRAGNDISMPSEYVQVPETDFSSNKKTYSNGPKCTKTPPADSQTYKCNLCHFSSIYPHNLKRHVSMVHEGKGTDHGSAARPKKPQPTKIPPLELEETNSEEMSVMKCEHCDFATPVKLILKKHKLIHFSSSSCQCDQPHSDDHALPCHLCAFVSVCRKSLEIHQSLHSVFYKCDMCPYTTIHKSRLDFHEIKHSPQKLEYHREPSTENKNLSSSFIELLPVALPIHDDCETSVSRKSEIETFTEILETVDESPLDFIKVENALMDSQESLSSEPYILPHEPVNFLESLPSMSDVDGTNSQNCDLEGIPTTKATVGNCATIYSCGKCSYSTTHFVRFTAHESKHSETSGEGCAKIYRCDHCSYTTKNIANFTTHEFNHSGIKPYKCELCQFSTVRKESLKRHYLIHNGEKPFKCDFCESSFRQKIHLQNHARKLHASGVSRSPDKTASVKRTPPIVIKKEMVEVASTETDGELSEALAVSQPTINVPQTTNDLLYQSLLSMEEDELSLPPGDAVSPSIACSQTEDNPVTIVGERDEDSFQTTQEDIESSSKISCGSVELNCQNSNSEHVDMTIDHGTIPTECFNDSSIEERHPNELLIDQSISSNCLETETNSKQSPKNTDPLPTQSVGESNTLDNETVSVCDKDHSDLLHNHSEDIDSSKVHTLSTNSMAGPQDLDPTCISLSPETLNLSDNTPDATSPLITPVPHDDQQNEAVKQRSVNVSRLCKRKTTRFKRSPIKTRAYEQPKPRPQQKTPVTKSYLTERVSVNDSVVLDVVEVVDDPSKSDSTLNHKTSETELKMESFLERNCVGDSIKDTTVHEVVIEPELKLGNGEALPKSNNTHSQNSLVDESKGTNSKRVKHDRLVIHKLRPRRHSSSLYKRQRNVQNIKPRGRRSASATAVALSYSAKSSIRDGSDLLEVKPCSVRVSRLFPWQISNPLLSKLKIRKELGSASFSKKERMAPS